MLEFRWRRPLDASSANFNARCVLQCTQLLPPSPAGRAWSHCPARPCRSACTPRRRSRWPGGRCSRKRSGERRKSSKTTGTKTGTTTSGTGRSGAAGGAAGGAAAAAPPRPRAPAPRPRRLTSGSPLRHRSRRRGSPCGEQPTRGSGQFALLHAPAAPDQAQAGLGPRPQPIGRYALAGRPYRRCFPHRRGSRRWRSFARSCARRGARSTRARGTRRRCAVRCGARRSAWSRPCHAPPPPRRPGGLGVAAHACRHCLLPPLPSSFHYLAPTA